MKLAITVAGDESFSTGGAGRKATHYVLKVEIGGIAGLLAPLLGKQPPDSHVWILGGEAPAFVKSEQPLYMGGPIGESSSWARSGHGANPKGRNSLRLTHDHFTGLVLHHSLARSSG